MSIVENPSRLRLLSAMMHQTEISVDVADWNCPVIGYVTSVAIDRDIFTYIVELKCRTTFDIHQTVKLRMRFGSETRKLLCCNIL